MPDWIVVVSHLAECDVLLVWCFYLFKVSVVSGFNDESPFVQYVMLQSAWLSLSHWWYESIALNRSWSNKGCGIANFRVKHWKNCVKIQSKRRICFASLLIPRFTALTVYHCHTHLDSIEISSAKRQWAATRADSVTFVKVPTPGTCASTLLLRTTRIMLKNVFSEHSCVNISTEYCVT